MTPPHQTTKLCTTTFHGSRPIQLCLPVMDDGSFRNPVWFTYSLVYGCLGFLSAARMDMFGIAANSLQYSGKHQTHKGRAACSIREIY